MPLQNVNYLTKEELKILEETVLFASEAHTGQFRDTGEAFIHHPIEITQMLAEYKVDLTTLQAAILHDVVEDTSIQIKEIKEKFGQEVAFIVESLTKGKRPTNISRLEFMESYYTQILLAAETDIRVAIIKIFDRLHNIQTLHGKPIPKQVNYANETLTFFAPLAKKLGLRRVQKAIEEQAFFYLNPKRYHKTNLLIEQYKQQLKPLLDKLQSALQPDNVVDFDHTPVYSLYSNLQYESSLEREISLIVRTASIEECYTVLGVIHSLWKPINHLFVDSINQSASPFEQYLLTTIETEDGSRCTIKIMTKEQGQYYHYGILYKLDAYQSLQYDYGTDTNYEEFIAEYFQPTITVYNQFGEMVVIPEGATVVDYLFYAFEEKAFYATEIKVNGQHSHVNQPLIPGDKIVLQFSQESKLFTSNWVHYATTRKALQYLEVQESSS
ncbi:hypothetical protein GCM10008967_10980 [Bacillus carboniphilus]|uniref:HD/PDEase domain-containing protein n=1 Tax=Bacillus carboniphilus TaxID=86663 RepID=A0ABP3FNV8_9BACI